MALLLAAITCSAPTSPYRLPPPDTSLDPAALREGTLLYGCGLWFGGGPPYVAVEPPTAPYVLVDINFPLSGPSVPLDRATDDERLAVIAAGGTILYQFHFPALRVWLPTSSVPKLAPGSFVSILTVPDPRRFDWPVGVGFGFGSPYHFADADTARFVRLGGRVASRFEASNQFFGVIPDQSVPALRADPHVQFVESEPAYPYCD